MLNGPLSYADNGHFSSEFGQYLCIKRTKSETPWDIPSLGLWDNLPAFGTLPQLWDISTAVRTAVLKSPLKLRGWEGERLCDFDGGF